jgi:ferredoxin-fold anticodon binding domain-containing protein
MKVSEARKMIGQEVRFRKRYSGITETGIIKSVKGKNVEIDVMGMRDWLWLPDLVITPAPPRENI